MYFHYSNYNISKLGSIPENFVVRNHAPQITVLKQASLFITHGGMNSVSEAMASGIPMVVVPFVSDQSVNAGQVARLGLGRVLEYKSITAANLKASAFAVMKDEHIRKNLRKIQAEITRAPGNIGAVGIIETYYGKA